ncbi:MAG: carboxylesterase family protein [Flavisolibacter sp.]
MVTTCLIFSVLGQHQKLKAFEGRQNNIVKTANGLIQGFKEKSGIVCFKGIPYALPPVNSWRWKEPQPMHAWTSVRKADKFGPRAMQPPIFSDMVFRSDGMSEDCLYLNVWTPSLKGKFPVLVYFYGGGFIAGDGSEPRYDGEHMAGQGIVAITVNYRLGVFGFMAHADLTNESMHHASGNYGLLDQAMALKWVRQNIMAFGGDPEKITIAGESAGSFSVSAQMASPQSKGLIRGAIGESGSLVGGGRVRTLNMAEKNGLDFMNTIGVHSLSDMRLMNADTLLNYAMKYGPFNFPVCVDGYFFPSNPLAIYQSGMQAKVPLLAGWNSEEMNSKAILGNDKPTLENFSKSVRKLYGDSAEEVLKVYQPLSEGEVEDAATALAGDRFIAYSTWKWADVHTNTSGRDVYRYLFSRPRPRKISEKPGNTDHGAVHSAEIEYAMGNLVNNKVYAWDKEDYEVSATMQKYFANFIKFLNPNGTLLPLWPPMGKTTPVQVMHLDVNTHVESEKDRERYLLLDRVMQQ